MNPDQIHDCEVFAETGTCPHLHPRYPNEFPDFVATWLNGVLRIVRRVAELTRDEVTLP